jgi:hypothetical protein
MFKQFDDFKEVKERHIISYNEFHIQRENWEGKLDKDAIMFWCRDGYFIVVSVLPNG